MTIAIKMKERINPIVALTEIKKKNPKNRLANVITKRDQNSFRSFFKKKVLAPPANEIRRIEDIRIGGLRFAIINTISLK